MYRDAIGWGQSVYQFLAEFDWELSVPADNRLRRWDFFSGGGPLTELARYVDLDTPTTSLAAMLAAGWMHHLDVYLSRLRDGAQFLALRYNELNASREAEIEKLFHHAGLGDAGLENLGAILDEDSQKGMSIGRREGKRRLDGDQLAELRAVLARQPAFADPNLILPDIYSR